MAASEGSKRGESVPCGQRPGGVLGSLCLIVLFMKLCGGFPVGFLMNWFVVETYSNACN